MDGWMDGCEQVANLCVCRSAQVLSKSIVYGDERLEGLMGMLSSRELSVWDGMG